MQEDSSRAHSVMSSGKADASTSCLPSQCFDSLTKSCVNCNDLYKDNAIVGILLVLAAICVFLARKVRRQRRKRKEPGEESKERMDNAISSPSPVQQDFMALAADEDFALAKCPHVNGAVKVPGPPRKDAEKQRLCCQGNPVGDVIMLSPVSPCLEECNHCFPLPATELGATALVTTKTTQKTCINEEMV
ncbi:tumor necrosis factor receptor superfamily member 13C [Eudromia elegans]